MTPVPFAEQNKRLKPPAGVSEEDCGSLNTYLHIESKCDGGKDCYMHANPSFTSCWQVSPQEMEAFIKNGGRMYFTVYTWQHPIIAVTPYPPIPEEDGPLMHRVQ